VTADAVEHIVDQFALAAPVDAVERIERGLIHDSYLVMTSGGDYVVQRINAQVFRDPAVLAHNVAIVTTHLGGRLVPAPVAARAGGWLVTDGVAAWRAWHRVDGAAITDASPAQLRSAARLLGRFHAALVDLSPDQLAETLPRFHDPARRLAGLIEAVESDPVGRADGMAAEVGAALAAAPLAARAAEIVASVPRRVAHNDAQLPNLLFLGDDAECLLDLDTVMGTAWFWDVGDLLRTSAAPAAEDDPDRERNVAQPERVYTILDGYREGAGEALRPGSPEDDALEYAGAIVTYEQALRFLTDWILGDTYYRISRADQNRDRARAQLALFASLQDTVRS
jgi:Ser/Thr protein kinase RdoA (MazF antagonist)